MKILIALVVSSLFFFAGCGGSSTKVAQKPPVIPPPSPAQQLKANMRAAQEDNIREAVFRYMFAHNGSYQQQKARFYFLAFRDKNSPKDPSDSFMKRFELDATSVQKYSQSITRDESLMPVRDRKTGKLGLVFRIDNIKWTTDTTVEVEGGYHENGMSASGEIYRLSRKKGNWVVESVKYIWIS